MSPAPIPQHPSTTLAAADLAALPCRHPALQPAYDSAWDLTPAVRRRPRTEAQWEAVNDEALAMRACRRCPVLDACHAWAMATRQREGVWGGTNGEQREAVRRRARTVPSQRPAAEQQGEGAQPADAA